VDGPFAEVVGYEGDEPFFKFRILEKGETVEGRVRVTELQNRLRDAGHRRSTARLQLEIERLLRPIADSGLNQKIIPEAVLIGLGTPVWDKLWNYEETAEETWLTEGEHAAAAAFLRAATRVDPKFRLRAPDTVDTYNKVDLIYEDTKYKQTLQQHGLGNWDACYAVWSIFDWAQDAAPVAVEPLAWPSKSN
jgi:hypothetical protein